MAKPESGTPRLRWKRTGSHTAMAMVAILAVLTTIAGSALDHHFAERQAAHGHVFLNQVAIEHSHSSGDGHDHAAGVIVASGVVATGDIDATGVAIDGVAPPTTALTGDGDGGLRLVGEVAHDDAPPGLVAPPRARPPIV
ncbi:MAG: hypothetical protein O3C10_00930 [Chloroflexi bacterium]|nr:hypothetical protein [Chloroflexota bacterium]